MNTPVITQSDRDTADREFLDVVDAFDLDIRITVQPDPGHDAISYSQWHSCNGCSHNCSIGWTCAQCPSANHQCP